MKYLKNFLESIEILGSNNLMEAIKLNGFSIKRENDPTSKTIYFTLEDFDEFDEFKFELEELEKVNESFEEFKDKGGIIVFSTDVNAIKLSKNKIFNLIKSKIETIKNILFKNKKINRVLLKNEEVYGVTIGNMVRGRYKSKDGSLYDERSLSVEIIGIDTNVLNRVAKELAKEFKQETVLVKNYIDNKIYLISSD